MRDSPRQNEFMLLDDPDQMRIARQQMVEQQLRSRDIVDERVLEAMQAVPRHWFVAPNQQHERAALGRVRARGAWPRGRRRALQPQRAQ